MVKRAPPPPGDSTAAPAVDAALLSGSARSGSAPPRAAATPPLARGPLDQALGARNAFREAQGLLAGLTGCDQRRAAQALRRIGAQLGVVGTAEIARFFVRLVTTTPRDPESQALIRRFTAAALQPESLGHPASAIATLIAGGRGLAVHGELDLATAPTLAATFRRRSASPVLGGGFSLELRHMTFLDVSGLHALAEIDREVAFDGDRLHIDPPTRPGPTRLLRIAIAQGWIAPAFVSTPPTDIRIV